MSLSVGQRVVSDVVAYPLSRARLASLASIPFDRVRTDTQAIAIPRVAGTPGAQTVREYIIAQLPSAFSVTQDSFTQDTVAGSRSFVNVVATLNAGATRARRVVLAAHYDSKMIDRFVGATDSAVPCAMLLDLARMVAASDVSSISWGLQLIFFDGEEAFNYWTSTDSLYGSRHLASLWDSEGSNSANSLQKISLFVLFDLVGAADNKFFNFFPQTSLQFKVFFFFFFFISVLSFLQELVYMSRALKKANLLHENSLSKTYFGDTFYGGPIEDDHLPFLNRGVPVLHLISGVFPSVWHQPTDDVAHLDWNTVEDLTAIFRAFTAAILNLTKASA